MHTVSVDTVLEHRKIPMVLTIVDVEDRGSLQEAFTHMSGCRKITKSS